ncbi:hypothetical protein VQ643_10530 [Pseudomonas sp. F1_0610]|uniref:hypothetical protein n=1 Tax=Pseudomonas sp. F1_0610 TaxID=3114284 RepID=UPI0039C08E71
MNSALTHYENLRNSASIVDDLGCALPELYSASLSVENSFCTAEELTAQLADWHSATGWHQTRSSTALGMPNELVELLEGEWTSGAHSLIVRLVGPNRYQVSKQNMQEAKSADYCYREQLVWLRTDLCTDSINTALYRNWFQLQNHSWQAVASQFVGFTFIKEQK